MSRRRQLAPNLLQTAYMRWRAIPPIGHLSTRVASLHDQLSKLVLVNCSWTIVCFRTISGSEVPAMSTSTMNERDFGS